MRLNFNAPPLVRPSFIERTVAYQSVGIIPIWILAAKNVKRVDGQEFKISAFQWLFVTGSKAILIYGHIVRSKIQFSALRELPLFPLNCLC